VYLNKLSNLKGLGIKSEILLFEIGITTVEGLKEIGAVRAFFQLQKQGRVKPSFNYASSRCFGRWAMANRS
jgi:DNA transformation protein and related proteins